MLKVLWIMCNESLAPEVREILDAVDTIEGYSVWEGLYGADKPNRKARWGDSVWPGYNWAFWVTGEEAALLPLVEKLKILKSTEMGRIAGIKAWMQNIEAVM